jgi:hypothetical protein
VHEPTARNIKIGIPIVFYEPKARYRYYVPYGNEYKGGLPNGNRATKSIYAVRIPKHLLLYKILIRAREDVELDALKLISKFYKHC